MLIVACFYQTYYRITPNFQTTIDNILTNFLLYNCISKIVIDNISDQFPIFLQIPINYDKLNIKFKQFRLNNVHCKYKFIELLSSCEWMNVYNNCAVDDTCLAYSNFICQYLSFYNECFPLISTNSSPGCKQPWMTSALLKSCRTKNKL